MGERELIITVTIRYHNMLRHRAGVKQETITLPASTIPAALECLADRHDPHLRAMLFARDGRLSRHLVVFHNGKLAPPGQREIVLADGDELMLFPAISGG